MKNSNQELAAQVECLPPDCIKAVVLDCLKTANTDKIDLESRLFEEVQAFYNWVETQRKRPTKA